MKQIIPDVFTFSGLMVGRVYLIEDSNGLTLIDTGLASAANKILKQLADAGYKPEDVKRILITHSHLDHVGGLLKLQSATRAEVWCSKAGWSEIEESVSAEVPNKHVFADGHVFNGVLGGLQAYLAPGHSPGHVFYWQPDKRIVFCGDIIMRMMGRTTQPFSFVSPSMEDNRIAIKRIIDLEPAILCSGHGPALTTDTMTHLEAFANRIGVI